MYVHPSILETADLASLSDEDVRRELDRARFNVAVYEQLNRESPDTEGRDQYGFTALHIALLTSARLTGEAERRGIA